MKTKEYIKGNYLKKLIEECNSGDKELDHLRADGVLCDLLDDLGYDEIVTEFKKIEKWYA
jgi:hypothetical protein